MVGHWTFYYENGIKEKEGSLVDGNADGLWVFYDDNSKKSQEGSFTNGTKEGQWTAWFEDGRLSEGYYANGKKDATWTSWWDYDRTKKRCKEIIEMDKWLINGFFMIKMEI